MNTQSATRPAAPSAAWLYQGLELDRVERLLADHLMAVVARFGNAALSVIDLPSLSAPGQVVPAQVRVAATLLWTMEVDETGLLALVDALAEALVEGRLDLPAEGGGERFMRYWRGRERRYDRRERYAMYQRVFGRPGEPGGALSLLDGLARTLSEIARTREMQGTGLLEARARAAAVELATELSTRAVGMAAFAAREIVGQVREAMRLLTDPEISRALGGGASVWQTVRLLTPRFVGERFDVDRALARARAGLHLLEWLAEAGPAAEGGRLRLTGQATQAAEAWLAAARSG